MQRIIKPLRLVALVMIPLVLASSYLLSLYGLQIINGSAYYEQSRNNIVITEIVPASRGNILDRCGRLLVSNRISYNITIDRSELVKAEHPNGILLSLAEDARKLGIIYTDTTPISMQPPFSYLPDMSQSQKQRLNEYTEVFKLDPEISAEELMDFFREHYSIPESFTDEQARIAAGIRYELELRALFIPQPYYFASDVNIDLISIIKEKGYPGVSIVTIPVRQYHTDYAAHILGRIGPMDRDEITYYTQLGYPVNALVGKDGLEARYEEYLRGVDGEQVTTRNSSGLITSVLYTKEPKPGDNLVLTIDIECQQIAEDSLKSTIDAINAGRTDETSLANGGAVVVIDVKSGGVLASASYPTYSLDSFSINYNELAQNPMKPMFNRATLGAYSPGSTFKMVTAIAALNEEVITTSTKVFDKGRYTEYKGMYQPKCWVYPDTHGSVNVIEALEVSCNYFFYHVGDRTGIDNISKYARQFGLGMETGIELFESTGVLATREYKEETYGESWYGGDTVQASIGQSYNLFTPMQMATYCATIANNGTRYAAHFMKEIKAHDNSEIVEKNEPEVLSTVDADLKYFEAIKQGMLNVSKNGTASTVFGNYPIDVASKTGTVQLGENIENNAVFIAYAPYEDPQIAVVVVVESGGGGSTVTQIAKNIFDYYFFSDNTGYSQAAENRILR